jgi:hypothetical protein
MKPTKKQIAKVKREVSKMIKGDKNPQTSEVKGYFRYWWEKVLKI